LLAEHHARKNKLTLKENLQKRDNKTDTSVVNKQLSKFFMLFVII